MFGLKALGMLRISEAEELEGLDIPSTVPPPTTPSTPTWGTRRSRRRWSRRAPPAVVSGASLGHPHPHVGVRQQRQRRFRRRVSTHVREPGPSGSGSLPRAVVDSRPAMTRPDGVSRRAGVVVGVVAFASTLFAARRRPGGGGHREPVQGAHEEGDRGRFGGTVGSAEEGPQHRGEHAVRVPGRPTATVPRAPWSST